MAKKIFIVDDDEGILSAFEAMLEDEGYSIDTYTNASFMNQLKKSNSLPNLILLDVLLSGTDGRVLCKEIKNNRNTKHIPIIMLSAAPNVEDSVKSAGADGFIKKPFEMNDLLSIVAKHILSSN